MSDKRTASERIEDLERAVMSGFQVSNSMARDIMIIKDALKLLGNKVDSIMKASRNGEALTDENISKIMLENNIEDLRGKVTALVNQGILAPTDTAGDNTFLVGSETEADGKVVHPRIQFTYGSLEKDLQDALKGKKAGEVVTFKEDKLRFVVKEIYNIVAPKAPQTEAEAEGAPAQAAEQSSNSAAPAAPAATAAAPAAEQPAQGAGN